MKEKLYKLLFVDTVRLKEKGRSYAIFSFVGGVCLLLGAVVLYLSDIPFKLLAESYVGMSSDLLANSDKIVGAEIISATLLDAADLALSGASMVCLLFAVMGVLVILQGILYYRLYEVFNGKT
ncbi:MAG: hypothetical protein JKY67_21760 [Pseudomonadales bacterium]|nr:hypothetical protein [Pseudomonadales bacterium]